MLNKLSPDVELVVTLVFVGVVGAVLFVDAAWPNPVVPILPRADAHASAQPTSDVTPPSTARSMASGVASADAPSRPADPARPPVDETPQKILIFGDSMIDELMLRLADYTQHNGHRLAPVIWYGASTVHWSQAGRLEQLLAQHDPTFVIAVIGSAELTTRRLDTRRVAITRILRLLEGRKMIWIGPPSWTEDTGIDDLLAELVGARRYFRSSRWFRGRDLPRKKDGIHPTRVASAAWLDAVMHWTMTESVVPIRLSTPDEAAPRPVAQIFPPPGQ